jgi:enoyl-[acyl-carrier protein] reductase I
MRKPSRTLEPLAVELEATLLEPLDVQREGQLEAVFEAMGRRWDRLDVLVHAIAFAPKADLQGPLLDRSAAGFAQAMDVSVHIMDSHGETGGRR